MNTLVNLFEGGNAIGAQRIPKDRIQSTLKVLDTVVLQNLPISQWTPIGSTGKKPDNGDIDLAVETQISIDELSSLLSDLGIRNVVSKGFNQVSLEFPQYEGVQKTQENVQVDLMVGEIKWLSFMYMGYSLEETKYKPLTRTAVLYALLSETSKLVQDDNSVLFYSISPNKGFFQKRGKTIVNKKGEQIFKSDRVNSENNSNPEDLAQILGYGWKAEELTLPFEKIWSLILKRYDNETIQNIKKYVIDFLTKNNLEIPNELSDNKLQENTVHLIHIEDLVYEEGKEGLVKSLNYLNELFNALKGHSSSMKNTLKLDGSPGIAVASSYPPISPYPFVGMKNTFAKIPQVFTTEEEIDEKYSKIPDLSNKLKTVLKYVKSLNIPPNEIWKGDLLFTKEDLNRRVIDGENWITFKPNTIVYAVQESSEEGQKIQNCDLGIGFHTSIDINGKTSFNVDVSKLREIPNVFIIGVELPSLIGKVTLTKEESQIIEQELFDIEEGLESILREDTSIFNLTTSQKNLLNKFENKVIREIDLEEDQFFGDPSLYQINFLKWLDQQYVSPAKRKEVADLFSKKSFRKLFEIQQRIVRIKNIFLQKLNKLSSISSYIEKDGELQLTGHEGFVVSDVEGNVVKLVDRLGFSKANFGRRESRDVVSILSKKDVLLFKEKENYYKVVNFEPIDFRSLFPEGYYLDENSYLVDNKIFSILKD